MSWTEPKTWAAAVLTSTDMNAQIRDNLNYLKLNIALDTAVELTIASGAVTKTYSHHTVDTFEDAASDDLTTILGGAEGEVVMIRPANGARTVVLKHNLGNIIHPFGADIILSDADDYSLLIYNGTNWVIAGGKGMEISGTTLPATGVNGQVFLGSDLPGAYIWIPTI